MAKVGFDNQQYLQMQSQHIRDRIAQFGGKLYLEFGGKLFDDYHASRVLPGFEPDSKMRMLLQMKDQAEIIIAINAGDIEKPKTRGDLGILLRLLNPFAPHITEELWEQLGFAAKTGKMCCQAEWPVYDASKTVASSVEMAIQVNGKMKGTVTVAVDSDEETVKAAALSVDKVQKATEGMQIVKTILVKNRLINLIVKPR